MAKARGWRGTGRAAEEEGQFEDGPSNSQMRKLRVQLRTPTEVDPEEVEHTQISRSGVKGSLG